MAVAQAERRLSTPTAMELPMFNFSKHVRKRFKVVLDETWKHERPEVRNPDRGWYEVIPTYCGGFIGLYQEEPMALLQWYTSKKRITARKIMDRFRDTPGMHLDDFCDGFEAMLYFPADLLIEVCEMAGARRKRQGQTLTEEQKLNLAERGRKALLEYRLKMGKDNVSGRQEIQGEAQLG